MDSVGKVSQICLVCVWGCCYLSSICGFLVAFSFCVKNPQSLWLLGWFYLAVEAVSATQPHLHRNNVKETAL